MHLKQKLKYHLDNKKLCKVKRKVSDDSFEYSDGYIVDCSEHFVVMQEVYDFMLLGYLVFPISSITEIRFNNNDKYYDKIMRWEKKVDHVLKKHDVNLTDWTTIFKTIKKCGFNVIVENENPEDKSFDIGPIIKTNKTAVYIQYFNPKGILDEEPSKVPFNKITMVKFDDNYVNTFSKYLRLEKVKGYK